MSRKRSIKSVKASCDRLWSQIVRRGGVCERCGCAPEAQRGFHAHHVYGRVNHRLRFEVRNGMALCYPCHNWAENYTLDFAEWFKEVRPEDARWLQNENQFGLLKRDLHDYLELEASLKAQLAEAQGIAA